MRNKVSVGAFDLDQIQLPTQLKIATGSETINLLGTEDETSIKAGEVCYFDGSGPYNLDYNYRDAERTSVTSNTKNLLINVDGIYQVDRAKVEQTLAETIELITQFCGGTVKTVGIFSASKE